MESDEENDENDAMEFLTEVGVFHSFYPDDVTIIQKYLTDCVFHLESKGFIKFTKRRN